MPHETFLRLPVEKRNRFLDAAWEVFTTTSFADASVNQIVHLAGVPRGSFYQYFTDKAELFGYLQDEVQHHFTQVFVTLLKAADGDIFKVIPLGYDHFIQSGGTQDPMLERTIRLLQMNRGLDIHAFIDNQFQVMPEELRDMLDTSRLRQTGPSFVWQVFSLEIMTLAKAIMDSLTWPEQRERYRQEMEIRLNIIKHGSLAGKRRTCAGKNEEEV